MSVEWGSKMSDKWINWLTVEETLLAVGMSHCAMLICVDETLAMYYYEC